MTPRAELELHAAVVHGAEAGYHALRAAGVVLPREADGLAIGGHLQAIAFNAARRNWLDVGAHVGGIFAALSGDRRAHLAAAIYDGLAARKHAIVAND